MKMKCVIHISSRSVNYTILLGSSDPMVCDKVIGMQHRTNLNVLLKNLLISSSWIYILLTSSRETIH